MLTFDLSYCTICMFYVFLSSTFLLWFLFVYVEFLPFSFHSVKCILIEGTVGRELCDSATVRTSKGVLCQRYTTNCLYFVEGYVKYRYYLLFSSAVDKNALKWDTDSEFRSNFDPVLGSPVCYKFWKIKKNCFGGKKIAKDLFFLTITKTTAPE